MITQALRLSRKDAEALKNGKSVFGTLLSLRYTPSTTCGYSVTVSKKVSKDAVGRNRIRRRTYAALRSIIKDEQISALIMIFPKSSVRTIPFATLESDLRDVMRKAHLIS